MKTDAKTMAEIWQEKANNPNAIIQRFENGVFVEQTGDVFDPYRIEYRIKPKTIMVNGVEIPKPLDLSEVNPGGHYYFIPCLSNQLCFAVDGYHAQKFECKHLYLTAEEAIEASKKLFGIE